MGVCKLLLSKFDTLATVEGWTVIGNMIGHFHMVSEKFFNKMDMDDVDEDDTEKATVIVGAAKEVLPLPPGTDSMWHRCNYNQV